MRNNQPVSGVEHLLREDQSIISRTDLKGKITYVNQEFIEVSGFSEEELLGAPHNLVRHPDMPEEAFKDLWDTLQSGQSWTGVVKNRCRNGDHYWVLANATPVREDGVVTGYTSVRTRPSREQVAAAASIYALFKQGNARGWRIRHGNAVRTGEQGRGFAVVASEVRSLAQRSASAAKEIKSLINDSVTQVEGGTNQVGHARAKMEEIVHAVREVTDIMTGIASASAEQSAGIDQVREAVLQMDGVTQQNAALVEQAAAAAESLQSQGRMLVQGMGVFRLAQLRTLVASSKTQQIAIGQTETRRTGT